MLMMDGPILTRAATAPVKRSSALALSPRIYAKDDNSAEQGSQVAWQNMQRHELRQRQRHGPVDSDDNSTTIEQDLTPTSTDEREEMEGIIPLLLFSIDQVWLKLGEAGQAQHSIFANFRHLLGKPRRQPLSETGEGESIAAKRKVEYDKIRPNMRKYKTTGLVWLT
jgi:hypothetical protein